MSMKTYRELIAWQKGIVLVSLVYKITGHFPGSEIYGLTNQMRRAAISIPSNLAEGFGRHTGPEMVRFSNISMGSLFELQTQIEIAYNLQFINEEEFAELCENSKELERIFSAFIRSIN
jgi:four helix bundle protein